MTEKSKPTKQDISKVYNRLRQTPLKNWHSVTLLARMAYETNEEEFAKCITDGETPAMKLSPQEMEIVRGGGVNMALTLLQQIPPFEPPSPYPQNPPVSSKPGFGTGG